MQKSQSGQILIISLLIMIVITGIGIITFSITDTNSKMIQNNREQASLIVLANAVLTHGSTVINNTDKTAIPTTSTGAAATQYWTYGQVAALAPSGIMNTTVYGLSWWNTYGSSNNPFPTTGLPSQYTAKYIIEAQPFDATNNISTYKIIAFVINTNTGQMLTKQKMYFAKNAAVVTVAVNGLAARVNDGNEFILGSGAATACGAYTAYAASNMNTTLFNVRNGDIIYLRIIWNRYNITSTSNNIWANCGASIIQGTNYHYHMPSLVGQVTWNNRTITTEAFDDNPATSELDHFKSVMPHYTVQATLPKSVYTVWNGSTGAAIPNTALWLFPEMRSLWVMPDATPGVTQANADTYCKNINQNLTYNELATAADIADRYAQGAFFYNKRWAWITTTNYAGWVSNTTGPQYWSTASGTLGVWCSGVKQNTYLPTNTGITNADRRWPIESWYPTNATTTNADQYVIKVMYSPKIIL